MRRTVLTALALALAAASAGAQRPTTAPKRPRLPAGADTNDAQTYLTYANHVAEQSPDDAAAAYYWAARLNPGLGDALYGQRIASLLGDPPLLQKLITARERNAKALQRLDSLQLHALMLNPFLYRGLDLTLLTTYVRQAIESDARRDGANVGRGEIDYVTTKWLQESGPYMRGWMAYSRRDFDKALQHYADAMKPLKDKSDLRTERGRIFAIVGRRDSALAEFRRALDELRTRDAKDVVVLYNSKAVLEQSIGMLLEQQDSVDAAREAYGRALQEDLAYWPAHVQLGMLAAAAKDTATAMSELALASQIAPNDAYVHYLVGASLLLINKADAALPELTKASTLEPLYAPPHAMLGRLYEAASFTEEAVAAYERYLARASQSDPQRAGIAQRLAKLKSAGA